MRDLAGAVQVGKARELGHLVGIEAAGGDGQADGAEQILFLRGGAEMVGVPVAAAHVLASGFERAHQALGQHVAELLDSPIGYQVRHAALGARLARAVIAEDAHDFSGDLGRLVTLHEDIEGRSDGEASRAHLAADEDIEATNAALHCGYEREVL